MAEPDSEHEALRLKSLSEAKFKSGDTSAAIKYAKKAQRLSPSLPQLSEMLTCFRILDAAAGEESALPDYYRILQVEPFSHINVIKKQYKKLALSLHPDKNSSLGSEEAFKVVDDAFRVLSDRIRRKEYDLKLRIRMQEAAVDGPAVGEVVETFWTACSQCKLLHQFERKYLRQNLVCPSCRKSFRAVEIGDEEEDAKLNRNRVEKREATVFRDADNSNSTDSSGDELTLAEMQLQAAKKLKKAKINPKSKEKSKKIDPSDVEARNCLNIYVGSENQPQPLKVYSRRTWRTKNTIPEMVKTSIQQFPNTGFFDFDKDRMVKSFKKGQVWATYNDIDSMPRHYCLIEDVVSTNPFEVRVSWLDLQDKKTKLDTACGRFRVSRKSTLRSVNLFSHVVNSERAAREVYRIYPMKGSVWAIYGTDKGCYNIVLCLTSYSDVYGLSVAYLEKVDGFRTVFRRQGIGAHDVRVLQHDRVNLCSHQVPAKKIIDTSDLQDAWELDPACLPLGSIVLPPVDDR